MHLFSKVSLLACLFFAGKIAAQPIIAPSASSTAIPQILRTQSANARGPNAAMAQRKSPFEWGPFVFSPSLVDRFIFSEGLRSQEGRPLNSYVNTFSPGFELDVGERIVFGYTLNWETYSHPAFMDNVGHNAHLDAVGNTLDWNVSFSQTYSAVTESLVETARQTDQETAVTMIGANRQLWNRFSLQLTGTQSLRFVEEFANSYDWSGNTMLAYRISDRLSLSIGVRIGYTDLDPGAYMTYSSPQAELTWKPTSRISLTATGGQERRQYHAGNAEPTNNPIYGATFQYHPFQHTTLSYRLNHAVTASYYSNQLNVVSTWNVSASQRVLRHFTISGGFGQQRNSYRGLLSNAATGREDRSDTYNIRVSSTFLGRGRISVLYQGIDNTTNAEGFEVDSTQTGVEIGFRY